MSALFYSSIVLFDEHSRPQSLNFEDSPAARPELEGYRANMKTFVQKVEQEVSGLISGF